ncbi:MAG: ABC transporter substrate-binding protein [Desulfobacteraceae bacterium]|nr:MAG: ABC transporter substrate-binding protein [Desulfobacteraceae bacterium]
MKNKAFKFLFLTVVVLLVFSNSLFASNRSLNIAMILWRGETQAEQGFKDGLKELGYTVEYSILNAGQDRKKLGRLLSKLKPKFDEFDYIYTFGTTVSRTTRVILKDQIPQIFNVVTDPVGAGIVQSMKSSWGNISGMSDAIPLSIQIKSALDVIKFDKLGIFFNPREKNSMIIRKELNDVAKHFDFEVIDLRSPPAQKMLQENLQKVIDGSIIVDTVYLPSDSFLVSNANLIGSRLRTAKVKSIGATKSFIENGALMGVVTNYYKLGKTVARILDRHQKGEKLQNIPIERVEDPYLVINKTTSDILNISIPEAVMKKAIIIK